MTAAKPIAFDVLFRTRGSGSLPSAATRESFRPEPAAVDEVRAWLERHGATCHATGFGLAGSLGARKFRSIFGPPERPRVPEAIAVSVEAITVARPPEWL